MGAVVIIAFGCWAASFRVTADSDTTFYRDLGVTLTEATRNIGPDGKERPAYGVLCNFPSPYPFYVDTPAVVAGDVTRSLTIPLEQWLEGLRAIPAAPWGYRYLWFKEATGASAGSYFGKTKAALARFLEPFPKRRVHELERKLKEPGLRLDLDNDRTRSEDKGGGAGQSH